MNSSEGAQVPDDGIPVLTDVVEVAELPAVAQPGIDAAAEEQTATEVSLSLAMFPELEPGAVVELEREREPFGVDDSLAPNEDAPLPALHEPAAFDGGFAAGFNTAGSHALSPPTFAESRIHDAGLPAPAATDAATVAEPESRNEMETRIFEALAARLDRLIDERLEPVIEGSVEAAFAGVKAGLAASLNQAIREAVEQAVRDEFEKRP